MAKSEQLATMLVNTNEQRRVDDARLTKLVFEHIRKMKWDDAAMLVRMFDMNQSTQGS